MTLSAYRTGGGSVLKTSTQTITVGSSSNTGKILIVAIQGTSNDQTTSVTYDGVALTKVMSATNPVVAGYGSIWTLTGSLVGGSSLVVTRAGTNAFTYYSWLVDSDQSLEWADVGTQTGNAQADNTSFSISETGNWFGVASMHNGENSAASITNGASMVINIEATISGNQNVCYGSSGDSGSSGSTSTFNWSWTNDSFAAVCGLVREVASSGPVTKFWNGTAWVEGTVWNGTAWVTATYWNGTAWV